MQVMNDNDNEPLKSKGIGRSVGIGGHSDFDGAVKVDVAKTDAEFNQASERIKGTGGHSRNERTAIARDGESGCVRVRTSTTNLEFILILTVDTRDRRDEVLTFLRDAIASGRFNGKSVEHWAAARGGGVGVIALDSSGRSRGDRARVNGEAW